MKRAPWDSFSRRRALIGASVASLLVVPGVGGGAYAYWRRGKIGALDSPLAMLPNVEASGEIPARQRVLLVGDSRMSRWRPSGGSLAGASIVNGGVGGVTLAQLYPHVDRLIDAAAPTVTVVQVGINDLVAAMLLDDARAQIVVQDVIGYLMALVSKHTQRSSPLLLTSILPPSTPRDFYRFAPMSQLIRYVQTVNVALASEALPANVRWLDLGKGMEYGTDGLLPDRYSVDTLHLNDDGYRRFATLIDGTLAESIVASRASQSDGMSHDAVGESLPSINSAMTREGALQ